MPWNKIPEEEILQDLRDFFEETGEKTPSKYVSLWDGFDKKTILNRFGSWGNGIDKAGIPHDYLECPHNKCGDFHSDLGSHWRYNPDHRPDITKRQHEVLTGLLMGDGHVREESPIFQSNMIKEIFLEWLDNEMGIMGTGVRLMKTAEESAEEMIERDFTSTVNRDKYSDIFTWNSRTHPVFEEYRNKWYPGGKKKFPDDLELTPLILKVWYCCDGSKNKSEGAISPRVVITASNESGREGYFKEIFSKLSVSPRFNYTKTEKYGDSMEVAFLIDDSKDLWDHMGDPLPGFSYKWPDNDDYVPSDYWWTDEEEKILIRRYPEEGRLIDGLDRSRDAISVKATKMGIKRNFNRE